MTLLACTAAAFTDSGRASAGVDAVLVAPNPVAYRSGVIAASGRGNWFSRLRVPVTFALLSMSSRKRLAKEPFETSPLVQGQIEVTRVSETSLLVVDRIRFWSERMQQPRFLLVLSPKAPRRAVDAFILNHGWFDRPDYMLRYLHVDEIYNALLERGEVRPAILVIPDVRFESMRRLRSDPTPPSLKLIAEEIPAIASQVYGIPLEREHWAIGGFSFGGYMSLDIGRRYPGRFASVSVISGFFDPNWAFWPAASPHPESVVMPGPVPKLLLACGTNDWLFATMRTLHDGLEGIGIPAQWTNSPGGHTWKYWSSMVHSMLTFHLGADQGDISTR
jgi:enterochelin esterase-like enzyme